MQELMGYMRRAIQDYNMIEPGDRIAVGVSGGKDSIALLTGLAGLRRVLKFPFELMAITLDPMFGNEATDYTPVARLCEQLAVPYLLKVTDIGPIVFDQRKETNPCSLCARMRRGALHDLCNEHGMNKIALGHHMDDAVETFLMNLAHEGRIGCFSPVTYLSRKDITMIRPLVYLTEQKVRNAVARLDLPVVKSACPHEGEGRRTATKAFVSEREAMDPGFRERLFGAIKRSGIDKW